jgi:AcrR family transcriptional regulator
MVNEGEVFYFMNEKFFQLPLEKQERIIDAAYKVFVSNTYKKAPMSEIASEAGISKSLLFHYFKNKKELYLFLLDNAIKHVKKVANEYGVWESKDFFDVIHRILLAKCAVIRDYPSLYKFARKAYYQQDSEVALLGRKNYLNETPSEAEEKLCKNIDKSNMRGDIDVRLLSREIMLVVDGYLRQVAMSDELDADQIERDFTRMIEQWKKVYTI